MLYWLERRNMQMYLVPFVDKQMRCSHLTPHFDVPSQTYEGKYNLTWFICDLLHYIIFIFYCQRYKMTK